MLYCKRWIILLFLSLGFVANAQQPLTKEQKLYSLCEVWGFLKYYHPAVMSGKLDWDNDLIDGIEKLKSIRTRKDLDSLYFSWINSLGKIRQRKQKKTPLTFNHNFDTTWMNNPLFYSGSLSRLLHFIYLNRGTGKDYYATYHFHLYHFNHENPYRGMVYPSTSFRLLTLFRYWNIVNYFYPSKYLIGENWDTVLKEMLPLFINAKDTISYHLAILELVTKINDSHSYFSTLYTFRHWGDKFTPFMVRIINDKAVVTRILNDSLAKINDIKIGDAILQIDEKSVTQILQENWKYIPASNFQTKLRNTKFLFFQSPLDSSEILFERNEVKQSKIIHRDAHPEFLSKLNSSFLPSYVINNPWKIIDDSILYINPTLITKKELKRLFKHLNRYKGLIVDLRYYNKEIGVGAISRAIHRKKIQFVKFLVPCKHAPGKFYFFNTSQDKTGKKNNNYYRGKTVLLINEATQSIGELSCMMLQSAANVISIGSQTAGADGSAVPIILPGGYVTRFSEMGVYYPDGKPTQRIGLHPEIFVQPTIGGITIGKDELLDRAIDYLKYQK